MTDREKLEWLLSEADALVAHYVIPSTPAFQAWFTRFHNIETRIPCT